MSSSTPPPQPNVELIRYSLKGLLIGCALVACGVALVTSLIRQAALERRYNEIRTKFKMAQIGLSCFDDARRRLPPAIVISPDGQPLSSWRLRVAPYIGWNHGAAYNERWDSESNQHVRSSWAADFYCIRSTGMPLNTIVFGIAGPGTAFDQSAADRYSDLPVELILAMESANSKTHWMQPGDYDVAKLLAAAGRLGDTVKGLLKDRIHILFADGEVWALSPDTPIDALKPFLTITAAKTADRDKQLAPYRID